MSSDRTGVAFKTLGCKVNRVESEQIASALLGDEVALVSEHEARVVIVNSCTVTGEADAKVRKAIRHALSLDGEPVVVVTGCLATLDPASLEALGPRVVVEPDKGAVAGRVRAILGASESSSAPAGRVGEGFRTRAAIKIEDGCDAFCSYCIIPYARGNPRSVPLRDVISECESLLEAGAREFVLTGVNLGRYRDGGTDLAGLVSAVAATGVSRLRLSSIEPLDLTERLLDVLAHTPAVCPHLHVPLQSGNDRVLSAMNRTYTVEQYERHLADARAAVPGLAVTTDIIAGFPGETDDEARETESTCERIGFSKMHVFRYSPRKGTPAADIPPVQPAAVSARAEALRLLGDAQRASFLASKVGLDVEVLVESLRDEVYTGTTRDYANVRFKGTGVRLGDLLTVRIIQADGLTLVGKSG